ncbi:porin [Allosediminivita pacifica]|uniref:Outer membrane protein OmpU n=1 Tax=Allosediminivita pacifica TaxID=1267769 RepID=A0A2T6B7P2_9RHOB|nr:porin [Allosediminivita pacifica]PTX52089.1 outer membrane protein OmpU [Allosediminivita pacifica]GGA97221.1 porin [Allosediminivita pacifica]
MKKILLASTAMVAFAGAAAAEVNIAGRAEVGVYSFGGSNDQFFTDVDIDFDMVGEADNGMTFGASVDLDEANSGFSADDDNGVNYFIAYGGARLDAGDVDGAFDAALSETNLVGGSINDDETLHGGFEYEVFGDTINLNNGLDGQGDGQVFTFSYSFDAFTGYLSMEQVNNGGDDSIYGIGATYAASFAGADMTFGLGYQYGADTPLYGDAEVLGGSVSAAFTNGFSVAANYTDISFNDTDNDGSYYSVGVGYEINAIGIGVNYGEYDFPNDAYDASGVGVAATYDFGGGLVAQLGYGSSDISDAAETFGSDYEDDHYSIGLAMSF